MGTHTHTQNTSLVQKFRSPSFSPPLFYTHTHHFSVKSKYQTVQRPHTSELYYPPLPHFSFLLILSSGFYHQPNGIYPIPFSPDFFLTHKHIYRLYQKSDCLKIFSLSTTLFTHTHTNTTILHYSISAAFI